jgi:hypothetical protein
MTTNSLDQCCPSPKGLTTDSLKDLLSTLRESTPRVNCNITKVRNIFAPKLLKGTVPVRNNARIKYKLMGFMVYF